MMPVSNLPALSTCVIGACVQAALGVVQALQQQQERREEAEREAARQPYLEVSF